MKLEEHLNKWFGYKEFRQGQKEVITDLLQGKDVVAMLPTGQGKSMCYQLPGLLQGGTVLIVSPLLSLMEDQVTQLKYVVKNRVIAFNSFRTLSEKRKAIKQLAWYKFVFVSPEMLQSELLMKELKKIPISLFVVDEAHCISQWGYDFRTDYKKLDQVIMRIGRPPVLALTATATKEVLQDIIVSLGLKNVSQHVYSIDRPNIAIEVQFLETIEEKKEALLSHVSYLQGPGIIYCSSRAWTERLTEYLRSKGIIDVAFYHGGMDHEERMLIQQQFMNDQLQLVICTSAFGMGVNKPNTRYIIHFHYPTNIASYLQEIGRAGRDGEASIAILLCSPLDHDLPISIIEDELPNKKQIQFLFALLQEKLLQTKRLPIEDVAEICYHTAGLNEQHWRFLKYHLEKMEIVQQNMLILEDLSDETMQKLILEVEKRLYNKYNQLEKMKSWLQIQGCKREQLLQLFGYEKEDKIKNCCDYCGIIKEEYKKRRARQSVFDYNWETELQLLFGMGERRNDEYSKA
ncbi:RecQ family ATP-dependent DNA helicase [Bacillus cytotoxicus]|uniref:ATP-dependent DNA helicase, RecQ family n=2 Tax=Bacillus cytotoxicus TaxID=580165 RepID=A0AAX2CEP4_9BACI|nr:MULTISPECIES: ATP-dependent DNA helicase RecQ [Bacillus cereus group]ABS21530.1 ATP-dependent DNA helicase, RecQ family [Bacillus cytotoxicus NVH 391-98]AWC28172.1 ATP-dependent DNA helicase RecQ [Bacillus cytotoxicus]AWC32201.1 ATP-dependent DNA helicase RecQ [Bacillus cytotoxicus]AWC36230.1 ATP-dependent DNA helicase RecQ [Bacillus cytotoxicus]AWC40443.1 ATP-dependent DNA helicase RecQ [Bacillus cytotoxicus]